MNTKPEFQVKHSIEQKAKDFLALKKAKAIEADQRKKGARYERIDNKTFILKKPKNDSN